MSAAAWPSLHSPKAKGLSTSKYRVLVDNQIKYVSVDPGALDGTSSPFLQTCSIIFRSYHLVIGYALASTNSSTLFDHRALERNVKRRYITLAPQSG